MIDGTSPADEGRPEDACILFTTSGTTGRPKLVVHRQRGIVAHARDVASAFELARPGSVVLQLVPFCGAFGFSQAIAAIAAACPLVVPPVFDAAEAARLARAHGVTNMVGTNDMLDRMLAVATDERPFPRPPLLRPRQLQSGVAGPARAGRGARREATRFIRHERNPRLVRRATGRGRH